MCGICGYIDFQHNLTTEVPYHEQILKKMRDTLVHRGPDEEGYEIDEHIAFAHRRLAVVDLLHGKQPMTVTIDGYRYTIVYNGELYNTSDLQDAIRNKGLQLHTHSDTEAVLMAYVAFGKNMLSMLEGIYSFAIWDSRLRQVLLVRDRLGVKPLYYMNFEDKLLFGSELKALFAYPKNKPRLGQYGLMELFGLGPARTPGCGVFKNVHELLPGHAAIINDSGMRCFAYWTLPVYEHEDSYERTVEEIRNRLFSAIERQLISDVPICTLLSGGLDSSIVSSVAAAYMQKRNRTLSTYSFDFLGNKEYFKASRFQPDRDRPFVDEMVEYLHTNHQYLECDNETLYQCLYDAVDAKDMPGMADVDSSMLYFTSLIKPQHTVCLSGECADELFFGYPWFHAEDSFTKAEFPWSKNFDIRENMIKRELLDSDHALKDYVHCQYEKTLNDVPRLPGENGRRARQRELGYLNIMWFMQTLLERKDRMTMANGLEVRVPFADHHVVEYIYNVPGDMKCPNGEVKGLLKDAARSILPSSVIDRKKCPYPKTYHPEYEQLLKNKLQMIMKDTKQPLHQLINDTYVNQVLNQPSDYGKPWFGQLMAQPQLYAYLIQINYWLQKYEIALEI